MEKKKNKWMVKTKKKKKKAKLMRDNPRNINL